MKELIITPPEGYEIDKENSTFEKIVFKKKSLTYNEVAKKLFAENGGFFSKTSGEIEHATRMQITYNQSNNATTKEQLQCIFAKNKLANVAKYLNGNWKPDLNADYGFTICNFFPHCNQNIQFHIERIAVMCVYSSGKIIFKSEELAKQAIEILGEEEVKLALKPLY